MPDQEIENKVKQIIVDELGVDENEVTPNARFIDDLGAEKRSDWVLEQLYAIVDERYESVARTLGDSPMRAAWRVTRPLAGRGLLAAAVVMWARAISEFGAIVTAPVQKSVINDAGVPFTGHTEYLAERTGAAIDWVALDPATGRLDLSTLRVDRSTRLIAFPAASNALGTVVDPAPLVDAARSVGAITFMDAVHAAPHVPIDRHAMGLDVVVCSPYKFFGPHAGVLAADPALLERLVPVKVRPAPDTGPERWQTGTAAFEVIADPGRLGETVLAVFDDGGPAAIRQR